MATGSFILDYVLFITGAALGVIQIAAALNGLRGLWLFRRRGLALAFGALAVIGAFVWFFASEPRNQPDTMQGLNGNQQFGFFSLGAALALALTLGAASWVNRKLGARRADLPPGLAGLREASHLTLLKKSISEAQAWRRSPQRRLGLALPAGLLLTLTRLGRR